MKKRIIFTGITAGLFALGVPSISICAVMFPIVVVKKAAPEEAQRKTVVGRTCE